MTAYEPVIQNVDDAGGNRLGTVLQLVGGPDGYYDKQHDRSYIMVPKRDISAADLERVVAEIHAGLPVALPDLDMRKNGTTGLWTVVRPNLEVTSVSLGDCRVTAHAYNPWHDTLRSFQLNKEHTPNDPEEKARIEAAGGTITSDGRIDGTINVSSAFGDYEWDGLIGRIPRTTHFNLKDAPFLVQNDEIVIITLECDGSHNNRHNPHGSQKLLDFLRASKKQDTADTAPAEVDGEADTAEIFVGDWDIDTEPDLPDTEALARHFMDTAIAGHSGDNISTIVIIPGQSTVVGFMGDGHGNDGWQVAEKVAEMSYAKLER